MRPFVCSSGCFFLLLVFALLKRLQSTKAAVSASARNSGVLELSAGLRCGGKRRNILLICLICLLFRTNSLVLHFVCVLLCILLLVLLQILFDQFLPFIFNHLVFHRILCKLNVLLVANLQVLFVL